MSPLPAQKRRKIRKGTQSCWECKRRKIRCTFAAPIDATCDGCKSRRTKCISQEFDDERAPGTRIQDGRNRIESLPEELPEERVFGRAGTAIRGQREITCKRFQYDQKSGSPEEQGSARDTVMSFLKSDSRGTLSDLSEALLDAWPDQKDLDIILEAPISASVLFHGVVCRPYSETISQDILSPKRMLQAPTRSSHPILITRKLLMLSTFLQGIPVDSINQIAELGTDAHSIMSTAFKTATRLGTSDDELVTSLEGVECIMMESMYLNNAGNLRRAWFANRKAISLAQLLGLPSRTGPPAAVVEEETRRRVRPDYMWARLIMSDRYLSLLLGLPHASADDAFAYPQVLEKCDAVDRMERLEAVAGGLILQRSIKERTDPVSTQNIDKMLQDISTLVPPRWWLSNPDLIAMTGNDVMALKESIRVMSHFTHNHLLLQLHLPYITLPSSGDERYDYSKMTAANASRTIVTQFVSFRSAFTSTAYCRGIDFIAFIASTVLCIAHIESRRRQKSISVFQSLQHQRLSDRAILDQTLEIMEAMAKRTGDSVARKVSAILRPLLAIEDNSLEGRRYEIYASSGENEQESGDSHTETTGNDHTLRIEVPYFGTIMIESRLNETENSSSPILFLENALSLSISDRDSQPVVHPSGYEVSNVLPANHDWQEVPQLDDSNSLIQSNLNEVANHPDTDGVQENCLLVPGLDANVEEWALQGVDLALFSTLTHDLKESTGGRH